MGCGGAYAFFFSCEPRHRIEFGWIAEALALCYGYFWVQIDILHCIEQLHAFGKWSLEGFATQDKASARSTLVYDGSFE
jgi:hypothetical protein